MTNFNERQRRWVASQWAIPVERVKLPSEMTIEQQAEVGDEYGVYYARHDTHVYAVRSDGIGIGRRIPLGQVPAW